MAFVLVLIALVIVACVLSNKLASRFGVPMLLAFILLGMLCGSDGLLKIEFSDYAVAERVCSIALIFIMFYGGFGTRWKTARPVAAQSILLSSVGVAATCGLTGVFCHFILGMPLLEGLLIGAVLSCTDAASVFSVLRSRRLSLKYNTDSMLEVESGSNDPWAYMLTTVILSLMKGNASLGEMAWLVFSQVVFGAAVGVALALGTGWFLRHFRFGADGLSAAFMIAVAVLSYALPTLVGGNGYLSAYLAGIVLGNQQLPDKKSLVHFFDGLTSLMQMLIFFILGLLAFPSRLPAVLFPSVLIALFLALVARPAAVMAILWPFRSKARQQAVVSFAGLRGASSIVFAIMATVGSDSLQSDVFHIVFFIVLLSISLQGTLLPLLSQRLGMINTEGDVLKTFNDYTEEAAVQCIRLAIGPGHPWIGVQVRSLPLPPDTLLIFILRQTDSRGRGECRADAPPARNVVPDGGTVIRQGDELVLGAAAYRDDGKIKLTEVAVDEDHDWCGQRISQLGLPREMLIILIRRGNKTVIPNGNTKIRAGDLLVLNESGMGESSRLPS